MADLNQSNKSVLCEFNGVTEDIREYFIECLRSDNLTIFSKVDETVKNMDMVCTFSCLDSFLKNIVGEKNIYVSKPPEYGIGIETLLSVDDYLWCTAYGIYANTLIKIKKGSLDIELIPMPYDSYKKDRLFCKIIKDDRFFYLIPENSVFVAIYDIIEAQWKRIDIAEENVDGWYYSDAIEVGDNIYMMPNKASRIVKINRKNHEVEVIPLYLFDSLSFLDITDRRYEFCSGGALVNIDSNIYLYSKLYNCFMKYDTQNNSLVVVRRLDKTDFSHSCVVYDDCFWMFTMSGNNRIIKYDIKRDELVHIDNLPKMNYNRVPFHKGTRNAGKIIFVPGLAENAIEVDAISQSVRILSGLNIETYDSFKECWIYSAVDSDDSFVYLFETYLNKLVVYDIKNNKSEKFELHITENAWYGGQAKRIKNMIFSEVEPLQTNELIREY